jgi:hypothetical protein
MNVLHNSKSESESDVLSSLRLLCMLSALLSVNACVSGLSSSSRFL